MKTKLIMLLSFFISILLLFCIFYLHYNLPLKYKNYIVRESFKNNLSPELVASVIYAESKFNEKAISKAGALGLMQIMPATAREVAGKLNILNYSENMLFNAETNIIIGCFYLKELFNIFGEEKEALCAYNAGPNNVKAWLNSAKYSNDFKHLKKIPFKETEKYYNKIIKAKHFYIKKF